jgi:uncharacterized protein YjbI with pentapeptide repeats
MVARARSSHEMRFAITLATCPQCGTRVDPDWLELEGHGEAWAYTGACRRCRTPLAFTFRSIGDPIRAEVRQGELGGAAPSEIIAPGQLVAEIDRLVPLVRADPQRLPLDEWRASRDANARLRTCLAELAKFVPAGAAAIPDAALGDADRADRANRPERYTRAWIDDARSRADAVLAEIVADLPRIDALERAAKKRAKPESELTRDALRAHEAWVKRGKTGAGRLVASGTRAAGEKIGAAELSGAKLDDVDFTEVDLSYASLDGAQLVGAKLRGGSFDGAALALAKLERADIEGATFAGADLDRSQWQGARVVSARFDGARFGNAVFDGATFQRSSFVRADFSPTTPAPPATTQGARFEDCDLRNTRWDDRDLSGARFVRCKLDGVSGHPSAVDGVVIEEPDLSPGGDGSVIGIAADVLAAWRESN